jgi:16S rRNA U1498 N3-methylase RsmE
MRALFTSQDLEKGKDYEFCGDKAHHLLNVVRVKPNDEILLFKQLWKII